MMNYAKVLGTAASGMAAQAERIRLVSENVANADTPGYRRKIMSFRAVMDAEAGAARVEPGRARLDASALRETYDPSHPLADETGRVQLSNVNLMTEIADAREANASYEANLNIFDQARRMYGGVLELLRR